MSRTCWAHRDIYILPFTELNRAFVLQRGLTRFRVSGLACSSQSFPTSTSMQKICYQTRYAGST